LARWYAEKVARNPPTSDGKARRQKKRHSQNVVTPVATKEKVTITLKASTSGMRRSSTMPTRPLKGFMVWPSSVVPRG
jgi:hypothetical protein